MEGQGFDLFGVIEGKDDLVIIDEHRVQEDLDELLLAVNVGVVHVCELVQEEPDVFLLQTQLLGVLYDRIDFGSAPKRTVGKVSTSQTDFPSRSPRSQNPRNSSKRTTIRTLTHN